MKNDLLSCTLGLMEFFQSWKCRNDGQHFGRKEKNNHGIFGIRGVIKLSLHCLFFSFSFSFYINFVSDWLFASVFYFLEDFECGY